MRRVKFVEGCKDCEKSAKKVKRVVLGTGFFSTWENVTQAGVTRSITTERGNFLKGAIRLWNRRVRLIAEIIE